MKVILLKDVLNLGKKSDVKEVSDGYAKNYLIPNNLAKPTTENEIAKVKAEKEAQNRENEITKKELSDFAIKIAGEEFYFYPKIGKKSEVFGSVDKKDISSQIIKKLPESLKNKADIVVDLPKPLRKIGEHLVVVKFGFGIKGKIKVVVNQEIIK